MKKTVLALGVAALIAIGLVGQTVKNSSVPTGKKDTIPGRHIFSPMNITTSNDGDVLVVKVSATDEKGNSYKFREMAGKVTEFSVNGKEIPREEYSKYVDIFDQIENIIDTPPIPPVPPIAPVPPMPPWVAVQATPAAPALGELPPTPAPAIAPIPPIPPIPPVPPVSGYFVRHIIRDLRKDKIISEDDPLKFKLNNEGFTVNGVKQPEEVFKRYKEKYLDRPGDHFIYDHHGGSTHTEISTNKVEPEEI